MKENMICDNCNEVIDYNCDDYWETEQYDEIEKIVCPKCQAELSISWYSTDSFQSRVVNKEETK